MTSQISPLHRGATRFLNPSRDFSSFSMKEIGVKDVFALSSCEGFNLGSCFVGSSAYLCTEFVLLHPRELQNSKENSIQSSWNFPKLPLQLLLKRERFHTVPKLPRAREPLERVCQLLGAFLV